MSVSVDDIISACSPVVFTVDWDSTKMYVYTDASNQVPVLPNVADPANFLFQTAGASRFTKGASSLLDPTNNAAMNVTSPTRLAAMTQFHLIVRCKKVNSSTRNVIIGGGTASSQNNRLDIMHNGTQSPANHFGIIERGSSGQTVHQITFPATSVDFETYDFTASGGVYAGYINRALQPLTESGSNLGRTWANLSVTPTTFFRGGVPGLIGQGEYKYLIILDHVASTTERDLIATWESENGL